MQTTNAFDAKTAEGLQHRRLLAQKGLAKFTELALNVVAFSVLQLLFQVVGKIFAQFFFAFFSKSLHHAVYGALYDWLVINLNAVVRWQFILVGKRSDHALHKTVYGAYVEVVKIAQYILQSLQAVSPNHNWSVATHFAVSFG